MISSETEESIGKPSAAYWADLGNEPMKLLNFWDIITITASMSICIFLTPIRRRFEFCWDISKRNWFLKWDLYQSEIQILKISRFRVLGSMVCKKTKPIHFTVNQRDLMGGQTVEPPGTFVSEILHMLQNRRHESYPALDHDTVCRWEYKITFNFREY